MTTPQTLELHVKIMTLEYAIGTQPADTFESRIQQYISPLFALYAVVALDDMILSARVVLHFSTYLVIKIHISFTVVCNK